MRAWGEVGVKGEVIGVCSVRMKNSAAERTHVGYKPFRVGEETSRSGNSFFPLRLFMNLGRELPSLGRPYEDRGLLSFGKTPRNRSNGRLRKRQEREGGRVHRDAPRLLCGGCGKKACQIERQRLVLVQGCADRLVVIDQRQS